MLPLLFAGAIDIVVGWVGGGDVCVCVVWGGGDTCEHALDPRLSLHLTTSMSDVSVTDVIAGILATNMLFALATN